MGGHSIVEKFYAVIWASHSRWSTGAYQVMSSWFKWFVITVGFSPSMSLDGLALLWMLWSLSSLRCGWRRQSILIRMNIFLQIRVCELVAFIFWGNPVMYRFDQATHWHSSQSIPLQSMIWQTTQKRLQLKELSTLCTAVEHTFGCLKGCFPALWPLPGTHLKSMWETVEVLLIIHNILTESGDKPYEIQVLMVRRIWIPILMRWQWISLCLMPQATHVWQRMSSLVLPIEPYLREWSMPLSWLCFHPWGEVV